MYFKDQNGCLHFLSDEDVSNGNMELLPPGCIEITDEEAIEVRAPSHEQMAIAIRSTRDALLRTVYDPAIFILMRMRRTAPAEQQGAVSAKLAQLDAYAQALQDVPQQDGFPDTVVWPTLPSKEL